MKIDSDAGTVQLLCWGCGKPIGRKVSYKQLPVRLKGTCKECNLTISVYVSK